MQEEANVRADEEPTIPDLVDEVRAGKMTRRQT